MSPQFRFPRLLSPLVGLTALVGLIAAAPQAAQAQGRKLLPIRLKLGVYLPSDRDTRSLSGSTTHPSGEIDLALSPTGGSGGQTLLSVGYSYKGTDRDGFDRSYQVIPVSLTQISSPPNPAGRITGNIYYGAGVGLYFVRAFGIVSPTRTSGNFSFIYSKSRTLVGASLVAGYQTPGPVFIEGKVHVVKGTVEGYSPNGLSLFVGIRL